MSEPDNRSSNRNKTQMFQSQTQSATSKIEAANILAGYKNNAGAYDELLAADQSLRPHYAKLFGTLGELSPADFRHRHDTCERFIQEQGITYHVYGDPRGLERPWQLDPVPFIIAPDEWRASSGTARR